MVSQSLQRLLSIEVRRIGTTISSSGPDQPTSPEPMLTRPCLKIKHLSEVASHGCPGDVIQRKIPRCHPSNRQSRDPVEALPPGGLLEASCPPVVWKLEHVPDVRSARRVGIHHVFQVISSESSADR